MAQKVEKFKRKTHIERTGPAWRSESMSSEEESLSPLEKKVKSTDHMESESGSETDDVVATLGVVKKVMPKIELVLEKLDKMEKKLDSLESYVKVVDGKVNRLQEKVEHFESFSKDAALSLKVLDEGMSFMNSEIEIMKENIKLWEEKTARVERKLQGEIETLRDEKLYMEVYQRRENLRFYGIRESSGTTEENVKEVLVGFMQNELDISEAHTIEFQRIHRIGRLNPSQDKPRPIIARFLRYSYRELVMSRANKLKGKGLGISADLPKDIVNRRKQSMPKFKKAKEDGQSAYFKRSEPDKLYIEGIRVY